MTNKLKRLISFILLVVMLVGVMPMNVFADANVDGSNLDVKDGKILASYWANISSYGYYKRNPSGITAGSGKGASSVGTDISVVSGDTIRFFAGTGYGDIMKDTYTVRTYRQLTLGTNVTSISGDNTTSSNRVYYDGNNATPTIKVHFTPASEGYTATVKYLGTEVGTYAAGVGECDITVTASGAITVEYNESTEAPGNVDVNISNTNGGTGNIAFNGGNYTSSTNDLTPVPGEYSLVVTPDAQSYIKSVKITVDGVITEYTTYGTGRTITATFTVDSGKEYTVDVEFEKQVIVTSSNLNIPWNGSWTASSLSSEAKAALKLSILRACIAEGSIPSSAIYGT